jgi:hypothetical protein
VAEKKTPIVGPWQVQEDRTYSGTNFYKLVRRNSGWLGGMETLLTPKVCNKRRFPSRAKAEAEAARLNGTAGVRVDAPTITDEMAIAFHRATSDGSIGSDDLEDIKRGLRAVFSAYGVRVDAPTSLRVRALTPGEVAEVKSGADRSDEVFALNVLRKFCRMHGFVLTDWDGNDTSGAGEALPLLRAAADVRRFESAETAAMNTLLDAVDASGVDAVDQPQQESSND